jgi:hypothetical protein
MAGNGEHRQSADSTPTPGTTSRGPSPELDIQKLTVMRRHLNDADCSHAALRQLLRDNSRELDYLKHQVEHEQRRADHFKHVVHHTLQSTKSADAAHALRHVLTSMMTRVRVPRRSDFDDELVCKVRAKVRRGRSQRRRRRRWRGPP